MFDHVEEDCFYPVAVQGGNPQFGDWMQHKSLHNEVVGLLNNESDPEVEVLPPPQNTLDVVQLKTMVQTTELAEGDGPRALMIDYD